MLMNAPLASRRTRQFFGITLVLVLVTALAVTLIARTGGHDDVLPEDSHARSTLPLPSSSELAQDYGGLSKNGEQQALVTRVGEHIVSNSDANKSGRGFRFYLLADENRINVIAMPDGNIFITTLLLNHLKTEGQLAAMLAHEIGQLTLSQTPYYSDENLPTFAREQELRADAAGVKLMSQAGYNPQALIDTLGMLRDLNDAVRVEFFLSHPSPVNRIPHIEYAISKQFPKGVPDSLSK